MPADLELARKYALAMALGAAIQIGTLSPLAILVAESVASDDGTRAIDESLRQAGEQAAAALKLDAQLGYARFVELYARIIRIGWLKKTRQPFRAAGLRADVADAVTRFPAMTAQFTYLDAHLDGLEDKPDSMIGKLGQVVTADSSFAEGFGARAVVLARSGRCTEAIRDLDRLRALSPDAATEIGKHLQGCRR
jgi:hypothetical protein